MFRFLPHSRKGSALLLIVVLSGFMLISFISFAGVVRESLQMQSSSYVDDLIGFDQFRESYIATGTGQLPATYFFDPNGPIRYGAVTVFSGSTQSVIWNQSGSLVLSRSTGAPFCYKGLDGMTLIDACTTQTGSLTLLSSSGTLVISSLGGYS